MDFAVLLAQLSPDTDVRAWAAEQFEVMQKQLSQRSNELHVAKLKIEAITLEIAHLRRMRFAATSESIGLLHYDLFDETVGADVAALEAEIDGLMASDATSGAALLPHVAVPTVPKHKGAGRQTLPAHLPRIEHRHELPEAACNCGACGTPLIVISEDVSEQLDVTPAQFFVHRHIRPQYACRGCETIKAAPVPAAVIDGGMAAPGLISWVITSKFADHLPLYRLEQIAARENVALARSTLAAWVGRYGVALQPLVDRLRTLLKQRAVLHADETPVQQLAPGKGKTQRAYLWAYGSSALEVPDPPDPGGPAAASGPILVFDYQTGRSGSHPRAFLHGWSGHLMVDDYVGYKKLFSESEPSSLCPNPSTVIELGCMAHARRKYFELHAATGSPIALEALNWIARLYAIEQRASNWAVNDRQGLRQQEAAPLLEAMKAWLVETRGRTANGGTLAKAIDYSLRRWEALSRYAQRGDLPIDNNTIENAIRPIAIGKKNWLFTGSERAGKRAAAIQSLFATAKRNQLNPAAWLTDFIEKLPVWPNSRIDELLPFADYQFSATH